MADQHHIYEEMIRITRAYLGPAAERFVSRQVVNHLHKVPEELTAKDLGQLLDWIRIAVSLLTDKSDVVENYMAELQRLAQDKPSERKSRGSKR